MIYDREIPDFALQPAKEPEGFDKEVEDDGFDPAPYDRLLGRTSMLTFIDDKEDENEKIQVLEAVEKEEEILEESLEEEPIFEVLEKEQEAQYLEPQKEEKKEERHEVKIAEPSEDKRIQQKIIPILGSIISSDLKLTDIKERYKTKIFIEEDILVPDVKPDLASVLSMDAHAKLSEKELVFTSDGDGSIKVSGEVALHTMYLPDGKNIEEPIVNIQSRLQFRTNWIADVSPMTNIVIKPAIESVDYLVVNERKIRAKVTINLSMKEYNNLEFQVFEGIKGEEVQLLKEKIQLTNVTARKNDIIELSEDLPIKESMPKPEKIINYDINIVENHKQISSEKAVINASVYCNIMYLSREDHLYEGSPSSADYQDISERSEGLDDHGATHLDQNSQNPKVDLIPCLYQGKVEFTQFISLGGSDSPAGSRIAFDGNDLSVKIKETEDSVSSFVIEGSVNTDVEIYRNLEKEIVTDIYHGNKDISCDFSVLSVMALAGSGVTDTTIREIINIPSRYGDVDKISYISAKIKSSKSTVEQGKNLVEGIAEVKLICLGADSNTTSFKITQDIPFRGTMEIPTATATMQANNEIYIKELWFDKINGKQIEVNAGIFITSTVSSQETHRLIENICFLEPQESSQATPGMVIYITGTDDTLWKIAKKYRTTMDSIKKINGIEGQIQLTPNMKLLIVK